MFDETTIFYVMIWVHHPSENANHFTNRWPSASSPMDPSCEKNSLLRSNLRNGQGGEKSSPGCRLLRREGDRGKGTKRTWLAGLLGPVEDVFPIENGGFSIAMLVY